MNIHWIGRSVRVCVGIVVAGAMALIMPGPEFATAAEPAGANAQKTLTRDMEPVVISGSLLASFANTPVDEIFVYAYVGAAWQQLPAQVDEKNLAGNYVATEDGLFDSNDEVVFMAADTGHEAPDAAVLSDELPISSPWYEIVVTDPVSATNHAWAYVVRSSTLSGSNPKDYVDFDNSTSRVQGETYTLGFATPKPWGDYLSLGSSNVDILDRNKLRVACTFPGLCPLTEEFGNAVVPNAPIKDGNVRVIIRDGRVLGYGSMLSWSTPIPLSPLLAGDIRISFDFSADASGGTLYNAAVPGGVTVDGTDDTMPDTPTSPWFQLSTSSGTIVHVVNYAAFGGAPTLLNFYEDSLAVDATDTGDGTRYGEIGTIVRYPLGSFPSSLTYNFNLYTFVDSQTNIGALYQEYYTHPFDISVTRFPAVSTQDLYLPMLSTTGAS